MTTAGRRGRVVPLLAGLAGCTFAPGTGFSTLEEATLTALLDPGPARDLGGGAFLTDRAFTVTPTAFRLDVGEVRLEELTGGEAVAFDPANPPDGYSLCHGGHCHADDGSLVSYADIEAELAGGQAAFVAVATLPVDREVDVLAGEALALDTVEPSAELPRARVTRLGVIVDRVVFEASLAGGDLPDDATLAVDLPLGDLTAGLELVVDRDQAPGLALDVTLRLDGTLLDGLDLAALAVDGGIVMDHLDDPGAADLAANLLAVTPEVTVTPLD